MRVIKTITGDKYHTLGCFICSWWLFFRIILACMSYKWKNIHKWEDIACIFVLNVGYWTPRTEFALLTAPHLNLKHFTLLLEAGIIITSSYSLRVDRSSVSGHLHSTHPIVRVTSRTEHLHHYMLFSSPEYLYLGNE